MIIIIVERTSVERKRSTCCTPVRSTCAERLSSSSIRLIIVHILFVVSVFVCVYATIDTHIVTGLTSVERKRSTC